MGCPACGSTDLKQRKVCLPIGASLFVIAFGLLLFVGWCVSLTHEGSTIPGMSDKEKAKDMASILFFLSPIIGAGMTCFILACGCTAWEGYCRACNWRWRC